MGVGREGFESVTAAAGCLVALLKGWWYWRSRDAECIHGAVDRHTFHRGATIFPQPLALAATFYLELMHSIATAISDELRAKDNEHFDGSGRHT